MHPFLLNLCRLAAAMAVFLSVAASAAGPSGETTSPGAMTTPDDESDHHLVAVRLDENLSLADLLETTLERQPRAVLLRAQQATAEAAERYGSRWIPEAPELSAFHLSDRALDDIGSYENEATLSFPLWLPGEKKAQAALGEAMAASQAARDEAFRWQVSGLLRRQAWRLMSAKRQWELAAEQEQRLQEVLDQVTTFTDAGDTSRSDLLSTVQELAMHKAQTLLLDSDYRDAVREFQALTGGLSLPADLREPLTDEETLTDSHPELRLALDRYAEASAASEVASQGHSARPSVDVFWRGFRGDRMSPNVDALGIGFSVPLGHSPSRGPFVAQANENLARAQADLLQTRRDLELALHEAHHLLHTTEQQLENAGAMVEAATERQRLDRLAFELGEISVRQWLRRLSEFREVERSYELLLLQQGAAVAACNQAAGESL
jgi:cobalt-zinc-cadmium efflux system outer membrane protein